MWTGCRVIWSLLIGLFRSRAALEAENLVLRQQILVLRRTAPKRLSFNALDRLILVALYRLFPELRNHADGIAAMDLFVVPTISFRLLYGLLILRHDRRRILWLGATTHPTAEWITRQLIEACGWKQAPHYLVHDRDRSYGEVFLRRVRAMGFGLACGYQRNQLV
jgi:hypothetical protein